MVFKDQEKAAEMKIYEKETGKFAK